VLLQDELENRINYYLKNQPFPLDILDLTAHRSGIFEIFSAWPINPVCQQSNSRQRATNSIQTTRANKRQGPTNKQTNKQANKQITKQTVRHMSEKGTKLAHSHSIWYSRIYIYI